MQKETVYLAGKITGDLLYRSKFYAAARELEAAGFIVINPATLPSEGFEHEAYMRITMAMLDECKAVCFLPDWKESDGAQREYGRAAAKGKRIFMFDEWESDMDMSITPQQLTKNIQDFKEAMKATNGQMLEIAYGGQEDDKE